jgi:hypothetical protein
METLQHFSSCYRRTDGQTRDEASTLIHANAHQKDKLEKAVRNTKERRSSVR